MEILILNALNKNLKNCGCKEGTAEHEKDYNIVPGSFVVIEFVWLWQGREFL